MQLLKQKLKTKKYQYLYLESKIRHKWTEEDYHCYMIEAEDYYDKRALHLLDWLERINKKYNYA